MKQYYIVSLKHTSKADTALTFWAHSSRGYTWDKKRAGIYEENELPSITNEDNVAVEREVVDKYWKEANDFGDRFTSVPNDFSTRKAMNLSTRFMKERKFASCRMAFISDALPKCKT